MCLTLNLSAQDCPDNLNFNGNNNPITVYIYNDGGVLIDSIPCQANGNGSKINCDLDSVEDGQIISIGYLNDTSCVYDSSGDPIDNTLPVELIEFTANNRGKLYWSTATETNNDYFIIEKSTDGKVWNQISTMQGQGNAQSLSEYNLTDNNLGAGITYYKLTQIDFDGQREMLGIRSVNIDKLKIIKTVNLIGQDVNDDYKGVVIETYENGEKRKIIKQ